MFDSKVYKHFKGGEYVILTYAIHTETSENLVIYCSIPEGTIYARPESMFFEKVTKDGYEGPRFIDTEKIARVSTVSHSYEGPRFIDTEKIERVGTVSHS